MDNALTTNRGGRDTLDFGSFGMQKWGGFRLPAEPENAPGVICVFRRRLFGEIVGWMYHHRPLENVGFHVSGNLPVLHLGSLVAASEEVEAGNEQPPPVPTSLVSPTISRWVLADVSANRDAPLSSVAGGGSVESGDHSAAAMMAEALRRSSASNSSR